MANPSPGSWAEQKVYAEDGNPQAWFGSAVAISGDIALVGAKNTTVGGQEHQGVVYVFKKVGGVWKQAQRLTASDGRTGDQFGYSVAMFGNLAIVTAPYVAIDGRTWQGAAYAFRYTGGKWIQVQKIVANGGQVFDTFGTLVSMNASWAFISAGGSSGSGGTVSYRVIVFRYSAGQAGGEWTQRSVLDAPDPADRTSAFGTAIAISGATAVVGSRTATLNGQPGQGAAYVYAYRRPGRWVLATRLVADDGVARDNFGVSVALDGSEALVGAYGAAINGNEGQGAIYRFKRTGSQWAQTQKFVAKDGSAASLFGSSMSLLGKRLLVGAYAVGNYRGAAYMFALSAGQWQQMKRLQASDGASGDVFGYYSALSKTEALVGAYGATIGSNPKQGAAYFFTLPQVGPEKA